VTNFCFQIYLRLFLKKYPPYLTIILYFRNSYRKTTILQRYKSCKNVEIDKHLEFPGALKYTLKSIVCHAGRSVIAGHYFTYTKTSLGWMKFDDDTVSPIKNETRLLGRVGKNKNSTAYVLLYEHDE